jgi:hypothetical protein
MTCKIINELASLLVPKLDADRKMAKEMTSIIYAFFVEELKKYVKQLTSNVDLPSFYECYYLGQVNNHDETVAQCKGPWGMREIMKHDNPASRSLLTNDIHSQLKTKLAEDGLPCTWLGIDSCGMITIHFTIEELISMCANTTPQPQNHQKPRISWSMKWKKMVVMVVVMVVVIVVMMVIQIQRYPNLLNLPHQKYRLPRHNYPHLRQHPRNDLFIIDQ